MKCLVRVPAFQLSTKGPIVSPQRACGMLMERQMLWSVFNMDAFQTSQMIRAEESAVPVSKRGMRLEGNPHSSGAFVLELCHRHLCQGK